MGRLPSRKNYYRMKKHYTKPTTMAVAAEISCILAGSDPKMYGTVYDRDGNKIGSNGTFGYGGDGTDGDVADSKGNGASDWGELW